MEILIALQKKKSQKSNYFSYRLQNQKTMVDPIQRKQELAELDGHLTFMNKC